MERIPYSHWSQCLWWVAVLTLFVAIGCRRPSATLVADPVAVPVPDGSFVPQVTKTTAGDIVLSWLEPRIDKGYRFRAAIRRAARWEDTVTIDDSPDITMFSANLPGVAELPGGSL